ncbi:hypothetical protein BN59_02974 [Legionella massiliensis]|uniref:DUF4239 domain-containing protein n=1 Tax=Legionella massiliensis TaxID=1034943 RepID=A0A078L066_9GAMM|nr:DUF4239 domain-containing protein [Legionella massiliensis]CDZ78662.1 hypothetical protein BN59_02974 [Legionella massiliensis]CEE14400.1 hypothetical protein BN1094_02974 [Legionella massiliensis]
MLSSLMNHIFPPFVFLLYLFLLLATSKIFRRVKHKKTNKEEVQTARAVVGSISSLYSIFLGFVLFILWNNYQKVNEYISSEASKLYVINESINGFPAETQKILRQNLSSYVASVLNVELLAMSTRNESPDTQQMYNNLYSSFHKTKPQDPVAFVYYGNAVSALNQLIEIRNNRVNMLDVLIPKAWYVIIFLGAVLIVLIYSLETDLKGKHFLLVLSAFLSCFLTAVTVLSFPFSGYGEVSNKPLVKVFNIIENSQNSMENLVEPSNKDLFIRR